MKAMEIDYFDIDPPPVMCCNKCFGKCPTYNKCCKAFAYGLLSRDMDEEKLKKLEQYLLDKYGYD